MIPVRIKLHGFMPFREGAELNFDTAKLWMLCGRNGAGKSTIFDAITFALFGEGRFGGNDVLPYMNQDVIRGESAPGAGRTSSVEFDFDSGSQRYRVRRICKLAGREGREQLGSDWSACKVDDHGIEGPIIVGTDSKKGYFDWLARTLGLNYEAFIASALLKQGDSDKLISSSNRVRDDILRKIINLSDYEKLQFTVKSVTSKWVSQQNDLETQMASLKRQITDAMIKAIRTFELSEGDFILPVSSGKKDFWLDASDLQKIMRLIGMLQGFETEANEETQRLQERIDTLKLIEVRLDDWQKNYHGKAELLSKRISYNELLNCEEEIERNFARYQELNTILPMLREWKKAQKDWQGADKRRTDALVKIVSLESELRSLERQHPELVSAYEQALEHHTNTTLTVGSARAKQDVLSKRKQELAQRQDQPLCQVCGKELSEQQRLQLLQQVSADLATATTHRTKAETAEKTAKIALKVAEDARSASNAAINKAKFAIKDQENIRDRAKYERDNSEKSAHRVIENLCAARGRLAKLPVGKAFYQARNWEASILDGLEVPAALPSGDYPNEVDLVNWEQEQKSMNKAPDAKDELDEACREADALDGRIAAYVDNTVTAASDIRSRATSLQETGDQILEAIDTAESAILAAECDINETLAQRIKEAVLSPLTVTQAHIRQNNEQQEKAKANALAAHVAHIALSEKQDGYLPLLPEWKQASHYAHLYETLAAKLGREGVQSWLRKEAEIRIVEYADLTLQRLSSGLLTVRLAENSDQTLDLQITDHEKNARNLKPQALSGSQKFRLSVALALGIGQYACRKSEGGIQSVIIDEGFGGLDKEGRDQMISELDNLGKILKRIIVVSHQEEFENAFANRWRIYVEGGTSKAELMV